MAEVVDISQISPQARKLLNQALAVAPRAYNAYSHFLLGAAVESAGGKIYQGTFMENASLGLTICAEPAALLAAVTAGDRVIRSLAVVGGESLEETDGEIVTPCGRCRQIFFETSHTGGADIAVYCANTALSQVLVTSVRELLPFPFVP